MNTAKLNSNLSAAPYEVGLSVDRLACISAAAQQFIDDGQLAGAVTVFGSITLEFVQKIRKCTLFTSKKHRPLDFKPIFC